MRTIINIIFLSSIALIINSCSINKTAAEHGSELDSSYDRELTLGTVQREIYKDMSGADVVAALGSPNIVTTDDSGNETWVYDKMATEASYSKSSTGLFLIIAGINEYSGAASVSQKTLTVIIKFDENKKVKDFSYHSSKF